MPRPRANEKRNLPAEHNAAVRRPRMGQEALQKGMAYRGQGSSRNFCPQCHAHMGETLSCATPPVVSSPILEEGYAQASAHDQVGVELPSCRIHPRKEFPESAPCLLLRCGTMR